MISPARLPPSRPQAPGRLRRAGQDLVFNHVHGRQLIYNACWEDPRIDRELLQLRPDSRVVMITSAGCNALDYLLDDPAEIHAVDLNFRQNALLELKLAVLRHESFSDLFELFGLGSHPDYALIFDRLEPHLSEPARGFWRRARRWFDPRSLRKSFYYQGAAGTAAWAMGGALFRARPNIKSFALSVLDADTLAQQQQLYALLEPRIWGRFSEWLVRQPLVMTLLGVPAPQIRLIESSYAGGLTAYVKDKLRHVLTSLPARENYFWRVYLTGSYTLTCCPNYLREENRARLTARLGRVQPHTCSVTQFLRHHPGRYSHYVLLDHQDWLAWHDPVALEEEWQLILANSRPGTKVLLRSAGPDLSFLPPRVRERLHFRPDRTDPLHVKDRVGTYGSLHLAEVR